MEKHLRDSFHSENEDEHLRKLRATKGNNYCFDCGTQYSNTWASLTYGVFLCISCAGVHRSFGTHISFIRSVELDVWPARNIKIMELGGNQRAESSFPQAKTKDRHALIEKYHCQDAKDYREWLLSEINKIHPPLPNSNPIVKKPATYSTETSFTGGDDDFSTGGSSGKDDPTEALLGGPKRSDKFDEIWKQNNQKNSKSCCTFWCC